MFENLRNTLSEIRRPISVEKQQLLDDRWEQLPESLKTDWQVLGRHLVHCSYLLGPSYCSFGCSHCYLPANANRVPLPTLDEMKAQIDANRRLQGPDTGIQITGGDVVDAYWRAGRPEELVEIVRYACDAGLVPMLMTHGQILLDNPEYFEQLVSRGGLRKVAIHIDVTQAGRPGFRIRSVRRESDLHPLRESFVDSILKVQRATGVQLSAALTVTVTERNLEGVSEILEWLAGDLRHLEAFGMVSFQTEADVGRTQMASAAVRPESVMAAIESTYDIEFGKRNIWVGDPDCSRFTTVLVRASDVSAPAAFKVMNLIPDCPSTRRFLKKTLDVFGGVGSSGENRRRAAALRAGRLVRHPGWVLSAIAFGLREITRGRAPFAFVLGYLTRSARPLTIVMHNFMSTEMIQEGGESVERRLDACAFKGAVRSNGEWVSVPMCSMNALDRESLYEAKIRRSREPAEGPLVIAQPR